MSAVIVIAVTTTPAPRATSAGAGHGANSTPSRSAPSSAEKAPAAASTASWQRTVRSSGSTAASARTAARACTPQPSTPTQAASGAGEIPGGDADARAGAPGGDRAGVHDGGGQPGPGVAQDDQAVGDRQTGGGVLREERDPLGAEAAVTRQRRRHDLGVRVALAVQAELGRHDHLSPALGRAAALHGLDDLEHGDSERLEVVPRQIQQAAAGRPVRLARAGDVGQAPAHVSSSAACGRRIPPTTPGGPCPDTPTRCS